MKYGYQLFRILLLVFLISSCNNNGDRKDHRANAPENVIHLSPSEDTLLLDLQPLLENTKILQLDNNPDALIGSISNLSIKNNSIIIAQHDRALLYFDDQGGFIGQVGAMGDAPGEYQDIKNISLNPSGKYLAIP